MRFTLRCAMCYFVLASGSETALEPETSSCECRSSQPFATPMPTIGQVAPQQVALNPPSTIVSAPSSAPPEQLRIRANASIREPYINLFIVLVNSTSAARLDEYCVCLRRNIKHAMVLSLNLVSALNNASAHLQAFCPLDVQSRERLIMHEVMTDPTYSSLFQIASASLAPETSSTLAVIAHADLVLTPGWDQLSDKCLEDMHSTRHAFQISRMEPRRCFPDSNLRPRSHVDKNAVYEKGPKFFQSMCDSFLWAAISQDAIAFNRRIDGQPWTDPLLEHLDFHPNRLNAEMRMGCALKKFGFALSNPCHDLGLMHNHCSSVRNYKGTGYKLELKYVLNMSLTMSPATIVSRITTPTFFVLCRTDAPAYVSSMPISSRGNADDPSAAASSSLGAPSARSKCRRPSVTVRLGARCCA